MQTVTSTEMQNHFGEYLDHVRREPLRVTRSGRAAAIMISPEEYEMFQALETAYWADLVGKTENGPFVGHDEAMALISKRLAEPGA